MRVAIVGAGQVARGRIKEAVGVLTGNDRLRANGKADRAIGKVKQAVEKSARRTLVAVRERDCVAGAEGWRNPILFDQRKGKKMDNTQLIILIVVLLILFGGGGGYFWSRRR